MGMMTSFTRIGSTWTGASKELLTNVLRGEWGFMGAICTDYNDEPQMDVEAGVVAGNDVMLANAATLPTSFRDVKNPSTVIAMRNAAKNIIYATVNSNGANGLSDSTYVTYKMSPWKKIMYGIDAVLVIIAIFMFVLGQINRKKAVITVSVKEN
jgi:beta-glucosidase